ncbi:amidohydrolase [Corynebacterium sp. 3HC-13]|nr:amidohydrolase [Corynebacterium poyangense]
MVFPRFALRPCRSNFLKTVASSYSRKDVLGVRQPSTAYLDYVSQHIAEGVAAVEAERRQETAESKAEYSHQTEVWQKITDAAENLRPELEDILQDLHAHPEVAFEERYAQSCLVEHLKSHGFHPELGVYGVGTSFRAEFASADFDPQHHRSIAIMAEYDALPGLGHACGHNIIAAVGLGAFISLHQVLSQLSYSGRVILIGTPAEEGHSGKEYMIRGGMLDGVDMAMMVHPFGHDIASHAWVGRRTLQATFRGIAAHASAQPFMGRNALDAASLAYQGMGLLRQQMPPCDRLHAVISDGGRQPSIIPDSATMNIYVRSLHTETLVDLSKRVNDILDGAALMTGTEVEKEWDQHPATLPVRNNAVMAARWAQSQARRGRVALPAGVIPDTLAASTDFGNVSQRVPGIHPMIKVSPPDVALHTEAFARWTKSPEATTTAVDGAVGLAEVAADLLFDENFAAAAAQEFEDNGGVMSVAETFG